MLISQISQALQVELFNPLEQDLKTLEVNSFTSLSSAQAGQMSFFDGSRPIEELMATKASAVIVKEKKMELKTVQLISKDPRLSMVKALSLFLPKQQRAHSGVSSQSFVHPEAEVSPEAHIYPFAYIDKGAKVGAHTVIYPHCYIGEAVTIGEHCTIFANVTLMSCSVGNHVIIYPGVVVGTEGFGFVPRDKNSRKFHRLAK